MWLYQNGALVIHLVREKPEETLPVIRMFSLESMQLNRTVHLSMYLPSGFAESAERYPLLVFQDGQDFRHMHLAETYQALVAGGYIPPVIIVGVHAGENRILEYGVASQADYKGRGNLAGAYTRFMLDEFLPYIHAHFPVQSGPHVIAGFSLGGLMALDLAWNHPEVFSRSGVFSGSLWWRDKALGEYYDDSHRIMHRQIRTSSYRTGLRFWFQTGTADETCDRDNDGVIDSIADTLDCIAELERKGYQWGKDIRYCEIEGGEHHPATWGHIMPEFLQWATRDIALAVV